MGDDKGMDLRSITERFAKSGSALEELEERLKSLTATSEVLRMNNQSTQEAAQSIRQIVNELSTLMGVLRNSVEVLRNATSTAAAFMKDTDLTALSSDVRDMKDLLGRQLTDATSSRDLSEKMLVSTRHELEAAQQELRNLKAQLSQIPEKQRKKFGI
jgi:DNA repair exonuclease SbcCD ATPase subunit